LFNRIGIKTLYRARQQYYFECPHKELSCIIRLNLFLNRPMFRAKRHMDTLIKKILLENGLTVLILDHTRRYYGDFYVVKIEIFCEVPVCEEFFTNNDDFTQARKLIGETVEYRRYVEQMGVPSTGIERAREQIVENFENHSLPYFSSAFFPQKLVLSHYTKAKKKLGRCAA
jgi:hypothetical protein